MYPIIFLMDYINQTLDEIITFASNMIDYSISIYFKVCIILSIFLMVQMIYMLLTEKTCLDCENSYVSVIDLTWQCTKNKDNAHKPHKYCSEFTDKKNNKPLTTLPTKNIETNKIYITQDTNENYNAYIYINNQWQQIDTLNLNLNQYKPISTGQLNKSYTKEKKNIKRIPYAYYNLNRNAFGEKIDR